MSFTQGARLGPYEILSVLGAGGMGEVYRDWASSPASLVVVQHWVDELKRLVPPK